MKDKIQIIPSNTVYKIGDILYRKNNWVKERLEILNNEEFKDTLLYNYLSKLDNPTEVKTKEIEGDNVCHGLESQELLLKAIQENMKYHFQSIKDSKNKLFIDVRAGDVIDLISKPNLHIWNKKKLYQKIQNTLEKKPYINEIIIVTSLRFEDKNRKSREPKDEFSKKSQQKNIKVLKEIFYFIKNNLNKNVHFLEFDKKTPDSYSMDRRFYILSYCANVILEDEGGFASITRQARTIIKNKKITQQILKPILRPSNQKFNKIIFIGTKEAGGKDIAQLIEDKDNIPVKELNEQNIIHYEKIIKKYNVMFWNGEKSLSLDVLKQIKDKYKNVLFVLNTISLHEYVGRSLNKQIQSNTLEDWELSKAIRFRENYYLECLRGVVGNYEEQLDILYSHLFIMDVNRYHPFEELRLYLNVKIDNHEKINRIKLNENIVSKVKEIFKLKMPGYEFKNPTISQNYNLNEYINNQSNNIMKSYCFVIAIEDDNIFLSQIVNLLRSYRNNVSKYANKNNKFWILINDSQGVNEKLDKKIKSIYPNTVIYRQPSLIKTKNTSLTCRKYNVYKYFNHYHYYDRIIHLDSDFIFTGNFLWDIISNNKDFHAHYAGPSYKELANQVYQNATKELGIKSKVNPTVDPLVFNSGFMDLSPKAFEIISKKIIKYLNIAKDNSVKKSGMPEYFFEQLGITLLVINEIENFGESNIGFSGMNSYHMFNNIYGNILYGGINSGRRALPLPVKTFLKRNDLNIKNPQIEVRRDTNQGLFSCLFLSMYKTFNYIKSFDKLPQLKDYSMIHIYKNNKKENDFFNKNNGDYNILETLNKANINSFRLLSNSAYYSRDEKDLNQGIIQKYFTPTNKIYSLKDDIVDKYNIIKSETLGIYYRGTDTTLDRHDTTYYLYVYEQAKEILNNNENIKRILVQTDDKMFYDYIESAGFELPFFTMEELPSIYSKEGFHRSDEGLTLDHNYNMLAMVLLFSELDAVLVNTCNVSRAMYFYREKKGKFFQILKNKIQEIY